MRVFSFSLVEVKSINFFQDLEDSFAFFSERGVGIINASPVAMGLLTVNAAPVRILAPYGFGSDSDFIIFGRVYY